MKETFKILFTIEVDTESGESKTIKKEIITDQVGRKSSKKVVEEDPIAKLTLADNKYILNSAALELLKASADDRIDIKYHKVGNSLVPIIGLDESFGTHNGNRLTKSGTVACRGNANAQLSRYGDVFTLEPHKDDTFLLVGNKDIVEETAEVPHDVNLNLDGLVDEIDENEEDKDELLNIDFKL